MKENLVRRAEWEFLDDDYFKVRHKIGHFDKMRQEALAVGNIRKYFTLSLTGGFEIESELAETFPIEYSEAIGSYNSTLEEAVIKNEIKQEYADKIKESGKRAVLKRIYSSLDESIKRDNLR